MNYYTVKADIYKGDLPSNYVAEVLPPASSQGNIMLRELWRPCKHILISLFYCLVFVSLWKI